MVRTAIRASRAAALSALALAAPAVPASAAGLPAQDGAVYARVEGVQLVIGNDLVERRWTKEAFGTVAFVDKRAGGRRWAAPHRDFALRVAGIEIGSKSFDVSAADASVLPRGGLRVVLTLSPRLGTLASAFGIHVTRAVEAYPGVAGLRTQTTVATTVPLVLQGYTLDELAVGLAAPTTHSFTAGADFRGPGNSNPPLSIGDPHAGEWRYTRTAGSGTALKAPGEWVTMAAGARSAFMVAERVNLPSSRAEYDGSVTDLRVEYSRDVIDLGPLEENAHIENPFDTVGRSRVVLPTAPLPLESEFTGFGDHGGDEAWQAYSYLVGHRLAPYERAITFNSNGTDADRISTGAKDDMDLATVKEVAPIARRLGIETFILDDGWQARSGDWQPDSPQFPEPRWDGSPTSKFKPRFPDDHFAAVRAAIAPMKLGLWMSPLSFNPSSRTFQSHPVWACVPTGLGTAILNKLQPDDGSNEAGIGLWNRAAIPHVESRIRDAIENWGVRYFKFDFLVWVDCVGQGDLYDLHDAFVAMIDRLRASYPDVTFQIDETNAYRMFPFESVARGPSWFQNGSPGPENLLHNLWELSPWIPTFSIGQHALGGRAYERYPVDTLMAAAMPSHITFFSDLRSFPAAVIDQARPWLDFYKAHRDDLGGMAYPLLSDPLRKDWTALQVWNPDAGRGALLAFRQDSGTATKTIALRNVPPGRTFELVRAPDGAVVDTVTSAQLTAGIDVTLGPREARVYVIRPA
jgi:hypothetical protein